jgi:hypothetical protein
LRTGKNNPETSFPIVIIAITYQAVFIESVPYLFECLHASLDLEVIQLGLELGDLTAFGALKEIEGV